MLTYSFGSVLIGSLVFLVGFVYLRVMSCTAVASGSGDSCANCGKQGSDTVKLKKCNACQLVKYCSVECQKAHRKQHKKACKKRSAELRDETLFGQGHDWPEEAFCPICTLPIQPPMGYHSKFMTCCVKRVCNGCCLATQTRGSNDCPFCRTSTDFPDYKSAIAMVRKRAEKKDPSAIHFLGDKYFFGNYGLKKDVPRAVEMWTEAAELGSLKALCALGNAHLNGLGGLAIDRAKGFEFWETAARKGHADSRHNLGTSELQLGNCDRAARHFVIAAKLGVKVSLDAIKDMFKRGDATKDQYAEALKGYQAAMEEMKSHDREVAARVGFAGYVHAIGPS